MRYRKKNKSLGTWELWAQHGEQEGCNIAIAIAALQGTKWELSTPLANVHFFPEDKRLKGLKAFTVLELTNTVLKCIVGSEAISKHSYSIEVRWPRTTNLLLQRKSTKEGGCILLGRWATRSSHLTAFHWGFCFHKMNYSSPDKCSSNEHDLIKTFC